MFTPEMVSGFWSIPPTQGDWDNLRRSRLRRMQLIAEFCDIVTLRALRTAGIQGVAVRLREEGWATSHGRAAWYPRLQQMKREGVDTLLLGVEIDEGVNLKFGSPSWHEDQAKKLCVELIAAYRFFSPLGLRIASPTLMHRGHYMDWREGLLPGFFRWVELLRDGLNLCDVNQWHLYSSDGTRYDVLERCMDWLWVYESLANKPVYLGEINCERGSDIEQMTFLVRFFSLLLWTDPGHPQWGPYAGSGERVIGIAPFVFNGDPGNPPNWNANFIIRDPAAYNLLGAFMQGERFYF